MECQTNRQKVFIQCSATVLSVSVKFALANEYVTLDALETKWLFPEIGVVVVGTIGLRDMAPWEWNGA
uniref:Uncharacterized protein n=1 Tax=Rhizophora mucronata TaxID=61149 RepID=A0A2P2L7L8_RHIMU